LIDQLRANGLKSIGVRTIQPKDLPYEFRYLSCVAPEIGSVFIGALSKGIEDFTPEQDIKMYVGKRVPLSHALDVPPLGIYQKTEDCRQNDWNPKA
jgi:hypothetical protein